MKMLLKIYLFFSLIFNYNLFVLCQNSEGLCDCDLTSNSCDLLCCCDKDCSSEDFSAFECKQRNESTYCVDELKNELIFSNTMFLFQDIKELICIVKKDNIYISQPNNLKELSEKELSDKTEKINPSNVESTLDLLEIDSRQKEYFTSTDRIWLSYPNNYITYFKIPIQIGPKCLRSLPINYLINQKTSCFRSNINLTIDDFSNIKIIPSPSVWKQCNQKNLTDFYSCDLLANLTLAMDSCKDCINNATIIRFVFEYSNPEGIKNAFISFIDTDKSKPKFQIYEVSFVQKDQDVTSILKKSGNPGYQIGEPIIAGTESKEIVTISNNRDQRMGIIPTSKFCNDSKATVLFGNNILAECFLKVKKKTNEVCETSFNEYIRDLILGEYVNLTHVAAYGSMIKTGNITEGEWVKIETADLPKTEIKENITCSNLLNELNMAITFALVGNVDNPQAKILNVKYAWNTVRLKLPLTENFEKDWLTKIRITFVDFTLNPEYTQSKLKRTELKLPSDFFKPFN